jgi:hypothetical protein
MLVRGQLNPFKGKVVIGKTKYLLNIVFLHMDVRIIFFPLYRIKKKEYSLIGKTRSFKLQISGSSQDALEEDSLT